MSREIISLHIGQAGIQVGTEFWKTIAKEHGIGYDGNIADDSKERTSVFFREVGQSKYVPRAILVDLEPMVINSVTENEMKGFFDPNNILHGQSGAANNWARGYRGADGEVNIQDLMSVIENSVSETESLQGFLVTHSIGGGTGSGFGSQIIKQIKEKYPKYPIITFSVFPSPLISDAVTEPYNSILALDHLIEYVDQTVVLDNHALYSISSGLREIKSPSYSDLNEMISWIMSGVTASLRFKGDLNTDLNELLVNLVPFPRQHFLTSSFSPIKSGNGSFEEPKIPVIINDLFKPDHAMAASDFEEGAYIASVVMMRGEQVKTNTLNTTLTEIKKNLKFSEFIPTGIKTGVTGKSLIGFENSGINLTNHTGITKVFKRLTDQFDTMYKRGAFVHWYESEGLTKEEMLRARENVGKLIQEYEESV